MCHKMSNYLDHLRRSNNDILLRNVRSLKANFPQQISGRLLLFIYTQKFCFLVTEMKKIEKFQMFSFLVIFSSLK